MLLNHRAPFARFALLATLALPLSAFAAPTGESRKMPRPVLRPVSPMSPALLQTAMPQYAAQYLEFFQRSSQSTEKNLTEITRVAEIVAKRHIAGGSITWKYNSQGLQQEMAGRSGGMINFGPGRVWKDRPAEADAQNIILMGWDRAPGGGEIEDLKKFKEAGSYLIGFGPRGLPELAAHVAVCDAWFDTGLGADDRVVTLPGGAKGGRGNLLANMLNGWAFEAELVAALTRQGKMPTMYQSYMVPEGKDWANNHIGKQFHDDLTIAPIAAGELAKAFLQQMRDNVKRFSDKQSTNIIKASAMIVDENKAGRKTVVAAMGHSPWTYIGQAEDKTWSIPFGLEASVPGHVASYQKDAPVDALVLRLGYTGYKPDEAAIFKAKNQRVMLISTLNPADDAQIPVDLPLYIDMEWTFGDAVTPVAGYPIKVFPPSGIMQLVAYESINVETLAALAAK